MRTVAIIGLLAGLTSALLYIGTASGTWIGLALAVASALPLFMAGLGWGVPAALVAGVCATVLLSLLGGLALGALYLVATAAAPVWLTRLALLRRQVHTDGPRPDVEWYPAGPLLLWLTGLACAAFVLCEALAQHAGGHGLPALLKSYIDTQIPEGSPFRSSLLAQTRAENWDALAWAMAQTVPALSGVLWQVCMAVNALLALALLKASRHALRPALGWRTLGLPRGLAVLLFAACAGGFLGGPVGYGAATLGALLFVPYFFLGLTVVHAIPARGAGRTALLGLIYLLLFVLIWPAILIGILGLFEQWSGMRARLFAAGGQEDI